MTEKSRWEVIQVAVELHIFATFEYSFTYLSSRVLFRHLLVGTILWVHHYRRTYSIGGSSIAVESKYFYRLRNNKLFREASAMGGNMSTGYVQLNDYFSDLPQVWLISRRRNLVCLLLYKRERQVICRTKNLLDIYFFNGGMCLVCMYVQ